VLGRNEALLTIGGQRIRLGRRHSELLVLLLAHPEGRTGDQLGLDLYHDDLNPVTVRAELSRLRRILGPELLDSRPYRLHADLSADLNRVAAHLDAGRVAQALSEYAGPLLPSSDAPGVIRLRGLLDGRLREPSSGKPTGPSWKPGSARPGAPTTWSCGRCTPRCCRPRPRPGRRRSPASTSSPPSSASRPEAACGLDHDGGPLRPRDCFDGSYPSKVLQRRCNVAVTSVASSAESDGGEA